MFTRRSALDFLPLETVRGILVSAPGLLAESYAGVAMARIAGADAREDLLDLMRRGPCRRSREGALYGLVELGDPTVAPRIVDAVRDRLVGRGAAGFVIAALRLPDGELVTWLRSADQAVREVAIDAVFSLSADVGGLRDMPLALAAREAITAGRVQLAPQIRRMLEDRIAALVDQSSG